MCNTLSLSKGQDFAQKSRGEKIVRSPILNRQCYAMLAVVINIRKIGGVNMFTMWILGVFFVAVAYVCLVDWN